MADQNVNMIVSVITKGADKLKEVNQDLAKTAKTQTEGTAISAKANDTLVKTNTNLGKQIPVLRELNPIMRQVGLGWMAGASAIAAVSAGAILCNQAFGTWLTSMTGLAVTLNTTTGQTWSFYEVQDSVMKLSLDSNMPMVSLAAAYGTLTTATHDSAISLDILTSAIEIHKATGLPLKQIVDDLTAAYAGNKIVYDDMKNAIPPGVEAVKTLEAQLLATANAAGALKASIDDNWSTTWESVEVSLGALVLVIKVGAAQALQPLKDLGIAIKQFALEDWQDALWSLVRAAGGPFTDLYDMLDELDKKIDWVDKLQGAWETVSNTIKTGLGFNLTLPTGMPRLQEGGTITDSGSVIVGDGGRPELLTLPAGAMVQPLPASSGGMQPANNHLTIYFDQQAIIDATLDSLNTTVRLRGGH